MNTKIYFALPLTFLNMAGNNRNGLLSWMPCQHKGDQDSGPIPLTFVVVLAHCLFVMKILWVCCPWHQNPTIHQKKDYKTTLYFSICHSFWWQKHPILCWSYKYFCKLQLFLCYIIFPWDTIFNATMLCAMLHYNMQQHFSW